MTQEQERALEAIKKGDNRGVRMLSILVPTIPSRRKMFQKLMVELDRQQDTLIEYHWTLGEIEILWDRSKSFLDGGPMIGEKREKLVHRASGKYLCFLDDDENIAPNYLETLMRLCQEDKDVCTFRNLSRFDAYWCVVDMSLNNPNEQSRGDEMVLRKPWHICPVKSHYAKQHPFPKSNYGEDWEWFEKVLLHCQTEAKTNAVIHIYNHSIHKSEADKITKA